MCSPLQAAYLYFWRGCTL
ncbi:hypothetical protein Pint_29868 [Pistacia integerrima]|uniref:Uncharacterized protein n=1 Tax=Pistacia integerrima TaxID=434235 RepID=A0ACC0X1U0_9ROSI|nr:hypothetical protein Pint_29868 [Pistacia integerrima]